MIPAPAECFRLMSRYAMLDNIRDHSIVVASIADFLATHLMAKGHGISQPLTVAGALLHDIGKTQCLDNDDDHAKVGRDICLAHRYEELAPIVAEHVILKNGVPSTGITEKEVVYYADKRVNHDRIVSLDERLAYILERYGNNDERRHRAIEKNFAVCKIIEEKIFAQLPCRPAEMAVAVQRHRVSFSLEPL